MAGKGGGGSETWHGGEERGTRRSEGSLGSGCHLVCRLREEGDVTRAPARGRGNEAQRNATREADTRGLACSVQVRCGSQNLSYDVDFEAPEPRAARRAPRASSRESRAARARSLPGVLSQGGRVTSHRLRHRESKWMHEIVVAIEKRKTVFPTKLVLHYSKSSAITIRPSSLLVSPAWRDAITTNYLAAFYACILIFSLRFSHILFGTWIIKIYRLLIASI